MSIGAGLYSWNFRLIFERVCPRKRRMAVNDSDVKAVQYMKFVRNHHQAHCPDKCNMLTKSNHLTVCRPVTYRIIFIIHMIIICSARWMLHNQRFWSIDRSQASSLKVNSISHSDHLNGPNNHLTSPPRQPDSSTHDRTSTNAQ